ncbi:MAG: class I mannose-6-phosphate isomerase [Bacteroidales bacterium]|nr:class I mannose-6-phosphate isomerase [Deltaproteobacteria bacterium]MBL7138559.1 class I mannose-6-phosphate isomerase [Bacteroidales bacterium]
MNLLYPLKFTPLFKDKVWGGEKIRTELGLDFSPLPNCGEAWVLSGVPGSQTMVSNGFLEGNELNEIMEIYMDDLVGEKAFERFPGQFPILVKFIDSNDWLSIQVHPDDALAAKRKIGNGKTEMWYILDADKHAELISGFSREVNQKVYLDHLEQKQLKEILNVEAVQRGDVFFMPAGRVHALGPGVLLAEIQQTSDTTYRIYDWDRVDSEGNARELHTELALEAIDFTVQETYRTTYPRAKNQTVSLVECPAFTTNLLEFDHSIEKELNYIDSFIIYLCTEGECSIQYLQGREGLKKGEVVLIPAMMEHLFLVPKPQARVLEIFLP